jgi:DNA polymerase-1
MAETLLLIDASSSIFRAFYALPPFSNSKGVPTNATLGFTTMLQKVLRETSPDYVVVAWDAPGKKRRKQLSAEYKATRDATPEDLRAQFPHIRDMVAAHCLASMEYEGEEADDVIATLTRQARQQGVQVLIVSTDKDLMQLVDKDVTLLDTMKDRRIGPAEVEERFGVGPERVLDLRALTGDSSDNIPGVRGVGEKTAAKLIDEFESLDALLENAEQIKAKGQREKIIAGREDALLSRELSRLRDDLPLELELEQVRFGAPDQARLGELFRELEFKRLLDELEPGHAAAAAEPSEVDTVTVSDRDTLRALVKRLDSETALGLGLYIEPEEAMRGELVAIALCPGSREVHLVLVSAVGEVEALEDLRALFAGEKRIWWGWDLKRDAVALLRRGVELGGELRDATLAAYVADSSQQLKPELLASAYLSRALPAAEDVLGKGVKRRGADALGPEELAAFAGAQVAAARDLVPRVEEQLEERGQLELFRGLEVPLVGVLARMEHAGVRIDELGLVSLSREIKTALGSLAERIFDLAGEEFKISSPKQLQQILFDKLKLPPGKKTKTGFSTDESVLEELTALHELPSALLEYRRLSKLESTYVDALPRLVHPETGRIHCEFRQAVATTGRLSASNPNLQNIPIRTPIGARIREMFIPAVGRVMLSADYSQIELRILAHLSCDETLLEAFRQGEDIHIRTASDVFRVPLDAVTREQRSRTKAINFGIIYGSSAFGLARQLGIAQSEAATHIRAYFERYPGVRTFLDRAIETAREQGYAETLQGRRRYLPDLRSRNRVLRSAAERMATNSVIQGTAADIIKRAMINIDADLRAPGAPAAQMILTVHDELVFEVAPADAERLAAQVESRMQDVPELDVAIEVHLGQGANWLEAH